MSLIAIAVSISCDKACAKANVVDAHAFGSQVEFVDCPKCDKRMRISEDGKKAFINRSKVSDLKRVEMVERAKRFLKIPEPTSIRKPGR